MLEYVNVRASETLGQQELVQFLKSRYPKRTRLVGRSVVEGTECVETRVSSNSTEFCEIRDFIQKKRALGQHGFSDFSIGWYVRKYSESELQKAEVLRLMINSHFEPCGEECGTLYETICNYCNLGHQKSELILDLRRVPQAKDISESIAWIEWCVSNRFVEACQQGGLLGAAFAPIVEFKNPSTVSKGWHQLRITGNAGTLSSSTKLGADPFSPSKCNWRCPLGHSRVTEFLSEIYLNRTEWNGTDIALTADLFGQGRNLLRPTPLIIISQKMFRALRVANIKGFSCEIAHLV